MHILATLCKDSRLSQALSNFRDESLNIYMHPIPDTSDLADVCAALKPLDILGALILDETSQVKAFELVRRSSLDAQEVGAVDTLSTTANGLIGEYNLGRAITWALDNSEWHARDAEAVILGTSLNVRAISRELASLGLRRLSILATSRPSAEKIITKVAANTKIVAKAYNDPSSLSLLEHADLLIKLDDTSIPVPEELLGPHLSIIDLSTEVMSPLRQKATNFGAPTLSLRDIQAHQVALSLNHILGSRLDPAPFLELLLDIK